MKLDVEELKILIESLNVLEEQNRFLSQTSKFFNHNVDENQEDKSDEITLLKAKLVTEKNNNVKNYMVDTLNEIFSANETKKETRQQCLHDSCELCSGSGKKIDGSVCIHYISCNCPNCSFR